MSVINQMLRDLDQRGQGLEGSAGAPGVRSVTGATLTTPPLPQKGGRRWLLPVLFAVVMAVGAAWYLQVFDALLYGSAPVHRASAPDPMAVASAPSVLALAPPAVPNPSPSPVAELPSGAVQLRLDAALDHVPRMAPEPRNSAVVAAPAAPLVQASAPRANPVVVPSVEVRAAPAPSAERPAPALAGAASAPVTNPETANAGPRQLAAARDALAQAQSLWAQGSQTAALELLRDALPLADRHANVVGMESVLVAMVREQARMQLALGQVQAAYDMLLAHESRTRQAPEVWALRGNAAQRLGLHADSVQAYMQALQSRPTEQRWLLGLAVSLAAMGQTQAATDVVERARAEGPIARDIANYLRQMGVTLR
ncbi:hypothetical protein RQP54_04965 [Curvibacter sp. APW13]|uniref:hypothetical protein n=1 Tax=Curvibacter sp. APW13 TaxID=3077236 RepID=UPI0028DFC3BB|nr:hypothetical protein [Curvibacter sp. APW13]MDT8990209.1 hypothetical protein [Curvibacter sp. APW13]